ncbi:MAG: polysaccharide biosynthesis tyrosine autokinase [Mojavia pulchra JT2-VF2]|jgi:capsular exopolysaccharide synthesis family protein|uniref:Polysaccharide biosynthesis tyrosine autokinase n=1 Tax=Mojavia pulchra JT2-VF2 TaxID=287848 RepID=A0A951PYJ9_9NOST|nr:polysaccharide biosynthesis tyrosine autokinase [Mojavia pulchra JT2-VF2]
MMENHFTKISSYEQNGSSGGTTLPSQNFSWFAKEEQDWDLKQFLAVIKRRALVMVGVTSVVMSFVSYSTLQQKPVYQSSFQLLVESVNDDNNLGKVTTDANFNTKASLDYESQIQVLRSPELMAGIVKQLQSYYPGINYNYLIQNLLIRRLGTTKIIEVTYRSNDPNQIKVVLDLIAKYYLNYSLEKRQTKLRQGVQFVEKQLPSIKNRVDQLQKELQIFRQKYNFISPDTQGEQIQSQLQTLSNQRIAIDQQLALVRSNYKIMEGKEGELVALNSSPMYQQLVTQLRQLEVQISSELTRFQPENPAIQTLNDKKQNLLPLIQQEAQRVLGIKFAEITTQMQSLEVQSQELSKAEVQLDRQAKLLPVLSRKYTELQRDLQIATESLNRFLATRETLQIQVAQTELPWELIQGAFQPEYPISPNITRSLLLGFVASSILGIGISLLLEKLDNTYHSVAELKENIKLPILGILPLDKKVQLSRNLNLEQKSPKQKVPAKLLQGVSSSVENLQRQSASDRYYRQGKFWESLQMLYTNIQLLNSDHPINSLIISSALPGDGKSTVAFQLAQIATAMGKRVLLVDADLRRPQIHYLSDLNNLWGLSSLISTNMPPEQVIRKMPTMSNLSIITSGPVPPDPARLLSSDKMKHLMAYFHRTFDLVIYDVPPMVGLVDARMLAPYTDGMVLVVRLDKTDKSGLMQAQDSLKISPINVLGIVANGDQTQYKAYKNYYTYASSRS